MHFNKDFKILIKLFYSILCEIKGICHYTIKVSFLLYDRNAASSFMKRVAL